MCYQNCPCRFKYCESYRQLQNECCNNRYSNCLPKCPCNNQQCYPNQQNCQNNCNVDKYCGCNCPCNKNCGYRFCIQGTIRIKNNCNCW